MDAEIKAQIIPIIESTKEGLAKAVDFLCEQSPILVKEILWWHGVSSAIWFILGITGIAILGLNAKKMFAAWSKWFEEDKIGPFMASAFGYPFACVMSVVAICTSTAWLKILIAPRLFLLEFMKDAIT